MSAAARKKRGSSLEGRKFRFVVQSAEEAVKTIREQLGENARVLSVEQVGGKGLAKFLSSPQLEVIATVPTKAELEREKAEKAQGQAAAPVADQVAAAQSNAPAPAAPAAPAPAPSAPPAAEEIEPAPGEEEAGAGRRGGRARRSRTRTPRASRTSRRAAKEQAAAPAQATAQQPAAPQATNPPVPAQAAPAPAQPAAIPPPDPANNREEGSPLTPSGKETLESLLQKANFDSELVQRMENGTDWQRISKLQLSHGLSEVFYWLKEEYKKVPSQELATRVAFMGTSASGKTTALCKRMATDVIVHGKQVQVLKVDGESPNPDDALRVLCEILNVELLKDPIDLERVNPDGYLYVDVPGIPLNEREQWSALNTRLDELWIESRVLVMNAAYERQIIKDTIQLATEFGCTHQVFTHLDELSNVTKLWQFILGSGLGTLFFSYGQNVTSEFSTDVLSFLTNRTFPSYLTN